MDQLTPRRMKMLKLIYEGPWPFSVSDLMDDDFQGLKHAGLIVCREDPRGRQRVSATKAGEAIVEV